MLLFFVNIREKPIWCIQTIRVFLGLYPQSKLIVFIAFNVKNMYFNIFIYILAIKAIVYYAKIFVRTFDLLDFLLSYQHPGTSFIEKTLKEKSGKKGTVVSV